MLFTKSKIFKFKGGNKGFTVLEILTVVAIVILISTAMLMQKKGGEAQRRLNIDSQKLVYNLRKVQNYAMSAKESECSGNPVVPFGIVFRMSSPENYLLVSDCNSNKIYETDEVVISTIPLENSYIKEISPLSSLEVFFEAPIPQTYINTFTDNSSLGSVTICSKREDTLCKNITINVMGTISAQQD